MELSFSDWEVVETLRRNGCAVVVFLPDELRNASSGDVEDRMTSCGWDAIDNLNQVSDAEYYKK